MGFKFKKSKDKKSKKKKGSKSKEEWNFEGGTALSREQQQQQPKRRTSTQERDDRLRRVRSMQENKKRRLEESEKMSKKVKFSDILAGQQSDDATDGEQHETELEEDGQGKQQRPANLIPAADRLQSLLLRKLATEPKQRQSIVDSQQANLQHQSLAPEANENNNVDGRNSNIESFRASKHSAYQLIFGNLQSVGHAVDDAEVPADDYDSDADEKVSSSNHHTSALQSWIFNQDLDVYNAIYTANRKKDYIKNTVDVSVGVDGTLTSHLHPTVSPIVSKLSSSLQNVQDIPGLNKLWKSGKTPLTPFARTYLPPLLSYADLFLEGRDFDNEEVIRETALMHGVFHVVQARAKVVKHNQRLKRKAQEEKMKEALSNKKKGGKKSEPVKEERKEGKTPRRSTRSKNNDEPSKVADDLDEDNGQEKEKECVLDEDGADAPGNNLDQGFTRPRLLVIVPFRHVARKVVQSILHILGENTSVANKEKFESEYADPEESDDEGEGDGKARKTRKPDDYYQVFAGNNDDDFKMGIQINPGHGKGSGPTKGAYVRLFSDFYISDVIVASPLGLKLIIDSTVVEPPKGSGKPNADFLSSIEMCLVHQADVLYMQNWEHVHYILSLCNMLPTSPHTETDYSRVRPYFLEKQGGKHKQLICTTMFNHAEIFSTFRMFAQSIAGQVVVKKDWEKSTVLSRVAVPVKQVYQVLPMPNVPDLMRYEEDKFTYFAQEILLPILRKQEKRILIVIPSYLDYVRVRNFLMQQEARAVYVCEYSRESEISRGRAWFYHGVKDIMVYSGRMHFFRRFRMRGAKSVIFYSLPEYPHFYPEIVNALSNNNPTRGAGDSAENGPQDSVVMSVEEESMKCLVLTSKLERLALERVIGPKRADHMLNSKKSTFVFF
eukprot:gene29252-35311_t